MSHLRTLFFLAIGAFLFTGCATFGSVQRANTMGKGGIQVGIEPGAKAFVGDGAIGIPDMTVSVRGGVSDRLDIGGRIGTNLWDLHMKYQFSDPEGTGPVVSLAPALSLYPWLVTAGDGGGGGFVGILNVPVLIGIPVGEHQFVFGPRLVNYFITAGENIGGSVGAANIVFAGSSFAFAARAGQNFSVIPELTVVYPVVGGVSANGEVSGASLIGSNVLMMEFKLGFVIGRQ